MQFFSWFQGPVVTKFPKSLTKHILNLKFITYFVLMNFRIIKTFFVGVTSLFISKAYSQNEAYLNPIFSEVNSSTVNYSDVFNDAFHKMDIYEPKGDTSNKRPVIIYIHGGAFYAGDKATPDCVDFCTEFAKKGYVAISVNYRLANPLLFLANRSIQLDAVLKTMADVKASIRYLTKDARTTNTHRIDSNAVFVGGYSAGAVAALHTAWVTDSSELNEELLGIMKSGIKTFEGDAGNYGYSHKIKGIFSLAGALFKTHYANQGDVPAYLAHAKDDGTVLYNCAPGLNDPRVVTLCGTGKIFPRLDTVNIYYDTMILETGGHAWPGLGNSGADFKNAVNEIAEFFYPLLLDNVRLNQNKVSTQNVKLFPNPSTGTFTVQLPKEFQALRLNISNIQGQTILEKTLNQTEELTLNLKAGLYTVRFLEGNIRPQILVIK